MSNKPTVAPALHDESLNALQPGFEVDAGANFKKFNPELCAIDERFNPRQNLLNTKEAMAFYKKNEAKMAHGYPGTFFLQGGLLWLTAFYTARAQGLPNPHLFYKSHWFDWIQFFKRGLGVGVVGGLVLGTVLFGDTELSIRRIWNRYNTWKYTDPYAQFDAKVIPIMNK